LVGFGFDACILSDAADQPPLILTTQGTLPCQASPPLNPKQQAKVGRHLEKVMVNSLFTDQTDKYAVAIVMGMILARAKAKKHEHQNKF
jgi:hypothetical protein